MPGRLPYLLPADDTCVLPPNHHPPAPRSSPSCLLLAAFGRSPTLTDLSLNSCSFGGRVGDISALALSLKSSQSLLRFRLSEPLNACGATGASILLSSLNGEAWRGDYSGNRSADTSTTRCMAAAANPFPPLEFMSLWGLELNHEAAAALGRCLMPGGILQELRRLVVCGNECIDDVAQQICRALLAGGASSKLRNIQLTGYLARFGSDAGAWRPPAWQSVAWCLDAAFALSLCCICSLCVAAWGQPFSHFRADAAFFRPAQLPLHLPRSFDSPAPAQSSCLV